MIARFKKRIKRYVLCIMGMLLFALPLILNTFPIPLVYADELDDIKTQIDKLSSEWQQVEKAKKPLEGQLKSLELQLAQIQASIDNLVASIAKKQKDLDLRTDRLVELTAIFNERVAEDYKNGYLYNPVGFIFGQYKLADKLYHLKTISENREIIKNISSEIVNVLTDKAELEKDQTRMASLQAEVDKNAQFLGGEIKKAKAYQADLSKQIAGLSARQQAIIAQRQASLNLPTSLGAGPLICTDDRKLDPGFRPAFAFFTFGIPHRVGMNQYGAYGRSKEGQNHEDILRAYFQDFSFEQRSNINISVAGHGSMPLETYLLGIYEMPDSWPIEALKAQAIAARSYALSYTNNGSKEICTSQQCQVYKGGNKGGNWEQAVKLTEGKTMISGGQPVTAWYSSTDGGYTFSAQDVGWNSRSFTKRVRDTNGDIGGFSDLFARAFDKDSPCFYAAQGVRSEFAKSAWLKSEEVADIANVIMLLKRDSAVNSHIYQVDKPNPEGTDTWNYDQVKQELRSRGGTPFNNASAVSILADFPSGMTTLVTVSGDGRSETFNGAEFKNFFNLRAPANLQIVGPLFTIETK